MKKKILQTVLFLGIMFLTFYTLLHGQNLSEIYQAVKNMSVPYLIAAAGLALFFVCAEGSMIWYLLTSMRKKTDSQTTVLCVVGKEKVNKEEKKDSFLEKIEKFVEKELEISHENIIVSYA